MSGTARAPEPKKTVSRATRDAIGGGETTVGKKTRNFSRQDVLVCRGRYIADPEEPLLADLAADLAADTGQPANTCLNYLKRVAAAEQWQKRKVLFWEQVEQRAEDAQVEDEAERLKKKVGSFGSQIMEQGMDALAVLQPKDATEAILMVKMGLEMSFRAIDQPHAVARGGALLPEKAVGKANEERIKNMPQDDYEAAARSDLAALTPEVGASRTA